MRITQRRAHARIWAVLGVLLPVTFIALMIMRHPEPTGEQAIMLAPPVNEDAQ